MPPTADQPFVVRRDKHGEIPVRQVVGEHDTTAVIPIPQLLAPCSTLACVFHAV
jgi:hypothetical protein